MPCFGYCKWSGDFIDRLSTAMQAVQIYSSFFFLKNSRLAATITILMTMMIG